MKFHTTPPKRIAALHKIRDLFPGTSSESQRHRILAAMQDLGHVTTFECIRHLDCYDPRPRKLELVNAGFDILTSWKRVETESGDVHRIGVYSLRVGGAA